MMKAKAYFIFTLHYAAAFVSHHKYQRLGISLHATKLPLVVVGNINEALGAAMAICAQDVILNTPGVSNRSPVPPAQPIAFYNKNTSREQQLSSETIASLQNALLYLGPTLDNYEQILASSLQLLSRVGDSNKPNLYTSIDFGTNEGAKAMQSLTLIQDRFAGMGLNLNTNNIVSESEDQRFIMSREQADYWGNSLQSLLDGKSPSSAAVAMGVRTHLAMLQANSLPRCRGVLGEKDVWAITDSIQGGLNIDNGDGMLFEYQYNYNDPFGGSDPLMCPSVGYIVPSEISCLDLKQEANDAFASAYVACVGLGLDHLSSIYIATSVKSVFLELDDPPIYSWKTIDKIVDRCRKAEQGVKREDGLSRKMYREFGYK